MAGKVGSPDLTCDPDLRETNPATLLPFTRVLERRRLPKHYLGNDHAIYSDTIR
jgi:hypothetical protein